MDSRKKKKTVTRTFSAAASLVFVCAVVLSTGCSGSSDSSSPPPPPPPPTYTGTLYMASEAGGHVAVVPVTIDPSNATAPIVVNAAGLDRIQLSTTSAANNTTHIFHDVRLDGTKLYYSSIFTDTGSNPGKVHLGYVDLANNDAVHDAMIDATMPATSPMMAYCGSGQSGTHFFPMTMSSPAYIDAIPKTAITNGASLTAGSGGVVRTFVDDFRANGNYTFVHGVNSPDGNKLFVAVNESSAPGTGMTGTFTTYLMNTSDAITAGGVTAAKVTTGSVPVAAAGASVAFRSTFTSTGKILQAGKDRIVVLDASNLAVLANTTGIGGSFTGVENHDVMPTPDGKYAILALRYKRTSTEAQTSGI
jgi:hypothetical protein